MDERVKRLPEGTEVPSNWRELPAEHGAIVLYKLQGEDGAIYDFVAQLSKMVDTQEPVWLLAGVGDAIDPGLARAYFGDSWELVKPGE